MKTTKGHKIEMEANIFAVCLLIPGDLLRADKSNRDKIISKSILNPQ